MTKLRSGIDLVKVSRLAKAYEIFGLRFLYRIYDNLEIEQFQKKQIPDDIEEVKLIIASSSIALPNLLKDSGMLKSTSEAMRLIKQGAVKIDEQKIEDPKFQVEKGTNQTYQVGKRNFKKINVT